MSNITSQPETATAGQNSKIVTDREIDFPRLHLISANYTGSSALGEVLGAAVYALEQWERCDGRKWAGFHDLLNAVERELIAGAPMVAPEGWQSVGPAEAQPAEASPAPVEVPPVPANAMVDKAMRIAMEEEKGSDVSCGEIWGASNDYNAKGRGKTEARRVLRGGSWEWLSRPAAKGRFLAGDRKDTTYGAVYEGEIIATYTLGGSKTADSFAIVVGKGWSAEKPELVTMKLAADKTKYGYRLTREKTGQTVEVSDPYWK